MHASLTNFKLYEITTEKLTILNNASEYLALWCLFIIYSLFWNKQSAWADGKKEGKTNTKGRKSTQEKAKEKNVTMGKNKDK